MKKIVNIRGVFIFAPLFLLLSCSLDNVVPKDIDVEELKKKYPMSEVFGVRYIQTEEGRLKAIYLAPHVMEMYVNQFETNQIMDQGVKIEFYDPNGKIESELRADYATYNTVHKIAHAKGHVFVLNKNGEELRTDEVYLYENKKLVTSKSPVKITTKSQIIEGIGMEANTDFTNYKIYNVKGIVNVEE